jgi:hypothetical protein
MGETTDGGRGTELAVEGVVRGISRGTRRQCLTLCSSTPKPLPHVTDERMEIPEDDLVAAALAV